MQIDDYFQFGKYKGLSLREVYQGTKDIDKSFLKAYILQKIACPNVQDDIAEFLNIEVSDSLLRLKCNLIDDPDFNLSRTIERIFRNTDTWVDDQIGNISVDRFNIQHAAQVNTLPKVAGGNPEYIVWCIKTVDNFYLDPQMVEELQSLTVFRVLGIEVNRKIEDIYEYKPEAKSEKFVFSEDIVSRNQEKYEAACKEHNHSYYDSHDDIWAEEDDEGYCPACQESPCMCSDSDPG